MHIRYFVFIFFTVIFPAHDDALVSTSHAVKQDNHWISLFNGKNLDGWKVKIARYELNDNFGNTFRVEDGVLKVSYDQYGKFDNKFGHLFYKDKFSHYRLLVEYRFVGEQVRGGPDWGFRNSGVMLHCQSPESMRKEQSFPVSIEAQFLGGNGKDERPTRQCVYARHARRYERRADHAPLHELALPNVSRRSMGGDGSRSARRFYDQAFCQRRAGVGI